jgi:glycosyltransferase involved in cell wall biosynthesis
MVVTEALAHGLPVVATRVGGVPEALGRAPGGAVPGLLVAPDDPAALADGLARWIDERYLRDRLRRAAASRRPALPGWDRTAAVLSDVLTRVGGRVRDGAGSGRR